ncbi:MAG TPA: phage tail protein, partial [Pseudolabrys sp.]
LYQSGCNGVDADPALVIQDFLTNARYGCGFPSSSINTASLLGASGDASFQTYCWAAGIAISPFLNMQEKASSILSRWLQITNATAVWTGGELKFLPYGDTSITGNGRTWNPYDTPLFDLSDEDYVADSSADPITIQRTDPFAAYNQQSIEIQSRGDNYATGPVQAFDQSAIDRFGPRIGSTVTAHEICDLNVARASVQLILQRGLYIRNTYSFKLSAEFCLLDPMDLVTLTDPALGLNKTVVRITDIEEDDDGGLTVTAEEFPAGVATATLYPTQSKTSGAPNSSVAPGSVNAPVIFEPPGRLTHDLEIWAAVSGATPANWGGCHVWASFDGSSYAQVGTINSPARMGVLTANLPACAISATAPTIDTTDTLSVSLAESAGQLYSGTATDAQNGVTLCYVNGEFLAYETATLTGANAYNLSYLVRGLHGSQNSIAAHASGSSFVYCDSAIFKYAYQQVQIGSTVYLKFTSFNIFGTSEESLAAVTAYSHVLSGTPAPSTLTGVSATLALAPNGISQILSASWSPDPLAQSYLADYSTTGAAPWTNIYAGPGTALSVGGIGPYTIYFRVYGVSANGIYGPYSVVTVANASPIGSTQNILVTYDSLAPTIVESLHLDSIQNFDDQTIAALGAELTQQTQSAKLQAQTQAALAGVTITQQAITSFAGAFAQYQTTVSAQFGATNANLATAQNTLVAQASTLSALSAAVTSVSAATAAGTANGQITFVAQSSLGSGVSAAYDINVSATGPTGTFYDAGLTVEVLSTGTSAVIVNAAQFWVLNSTTKTAVFGTNSDGTLSLQGVTKVASSIVSNAVTGSGQPVMALDFVNGIINFYA